jgi:hypothetical protein
MHIRISNEPYLNDANLAQITRLSGEVLDDGIKVTEEMIPLGFESKNDVIFNIPANEIQLKTIDQKKAEVYKKIQNALLNDVNLKELRNAMSFQKMAELTGADVANKVFTDAQIIAWGDYFGVIAKDNHDLSSYTLEQITPAIFGVIPDLPEAYQNIIG